MSPAQTMLTFLFSLQYGDVHEWLKHKVYLARKEIDKHKEFLHFSDDFHLNFSTNEFFLENHETSGGTLHEKVEIFLDTLEIHGSRVELLMMVEFTVKLFTAEALAFTKVHHLNLPVMNKNSILVEYNRESE